MRSPERKRSAEVLLVEDNDYNVDVGKQMVEFLGHRVTVVFNGQEAVDAVVARDRAGQVTEGGLPFDLVLMDCDMPVMNGFEATRTIRRWERTGVPFPPPDWTPCGTSLEPIDPEDCPRDSDLAACDKVACGVLCEGDGECGTDGDLDNCGGPNGVRFDVYRKICGEKDEPVRAPARPDLEPCAFLSQEPPEEEVVYID